MLLKRPTLELPYFPNSGSAIFADRSGIGFLFGDENVWRRGYEHMRLKKVILLNNTFRERGEFVTTPLILEEIKERVHFYSSKSGLLSRKVDKKLANSISLEFKRAYDFLSEGMNCHSGACSFARFIDVEKILNNYPGGLSDSDRELVAGAVSSGCNTGFFSSDKEAIDKYWDMTIKFDNKECYICDGRNPPRSYPIR